MPSGALREKWQAPTLHMPGGVGICLNGRVGDPPLLQVSNAPPGSTGLDSGLRRNDGGATQGSR